MALSSFFDAQTLPKKSSFGIHSHTFFGSDCICEICALVWVLACLRKVKGVPKALIFLTFSEPASEDASVAPFYQLCVDFNSDLLSLLDTVASP